MSKRVAKPRPLVLSRPWAQPRPTNRSASVDVLTDLAERINKTHADFIAVGKTIVERAMALGDLLIEAKEKVPHGHWRPWLRDNCPRISERTAQLYMQLARARETVAEDPQSAAVFRKAPDLSIAGILKRIAPANSRRWQGQRLSRPRVGGVRMQPTSGDEPGRHPRQNLTTELIDALHWLDQHARDAKALLAAFDDEFARAYSLWEVTSASLRDVAELLLALADEWDRPHDVPIRASCVHNVVDEGPVRKGAGS